MVMISVSSSAIRAIGYDGSTLAVEFHNGRIYDHPGVPESVFQAHNQRGNGSLSL